MGGGQSIWVKMVLIDSLWVLSHRLITVLSGCSCCPCALLSVVLLWGQSSVSSLWARPCPSGSPVETLAHGAKPCWPQPPFLPWCILDFLHLLSVQIHINCFLSLTKQGFLFCGSEGYSCFRSPPAPSLFLQCFPFASPPISILVTFWIPRKNFSDVFPSLWVK